MNVLKVSFRLIHTVNSIPNLEGKKIQKLAVETRKLLKFSNEVFIHVKFFLTV